MRILTLLLSSLVGTVVLIILIIWGKNELNLLRLNNLVANTPPRLVMSIQCDSFNMTTEETLRVVKGIWGVGTTNRTEPTYNLWLKRNDKVVGINRTVSLSLPLDRSIESGYLFSNQIHRAGMQGDLNFSTGYAHYSQEWFVDSKEITKKEFDKLASCLYENVTELNKAVMDMNTDVFPGNIVSIPVRGIYLVNDFTEWQKNGPREFNCSNGEKISLSSVEYISSSNGSGPWAVMQDGTIDFAWFATDKQRKDLVSRNNLNSCIDEDGASLTELYKKRASMIKPLF